MNSPGEAFVIQLARASRKANYIIRNLSRADRDDVIAAAIAWCWENRDNYSLTTTLDTWFVNAVKDALKDWRRGERKQATTPLLDIPTGDSTLAEVQAREAASKLMAALPPAYKMVATLLQQGYTRVEMMEQHGLSHDSIYEARQRIKQLRRLLPDDHEYRRVLRNSGAISEMRPPSGIDREIAQLESMPKHGADCPPCWLCKWFDGYMPVGRVSMRMPIQEAEVRDAVRDTEARKIEIAQEVRDGLL
jgi:DNA-directed RNA polymerase specialized sigma24 family protein